MFQVQTISNLIASLSTALHTTHCVEAGGGKGNLPIVLSLSYNIKSLTVDCDCKTIENAEKRVKIIQVIYNIFFNSLFKLVVSTYSFYGKTSTALIKLLTF